MKKKIKNTNRVFKKLENHKTNQKKKKSINDNIRSIANNNDTPDVGILNNDELLLTLKPSRRNNGNINNANVVNDYNTPNMNNNNNNNNNNIIQYNTRSAPPVTCNDFGVDRVNKYPLFFFCDNCSNFDDLCMHKPKYRNHETTRPRRYRCTANHSCRDHPTIIKTERINYRNQLFIKKSNMVKDSTINDAQKNVFNNDASDYNNNNDNNSVIEIMNHDNYESCEQIIVNNNNYSLTNDADNEDNINGVTTNLSCIFDNIIKNNNISSDCIEKCIENIDETMIESCNCSSDDSKDVVVVNNIDHIIPYDILYSKYIDICANNKTLMEQKIIMEHKMMQINLDNEALKNDVIDLATIKKEFKKLSFRYGIVKQNNKTTSKLINEDNLEYLIQPNEKLENFVNKILPALEKLGKYKNRVPTNMSIKLVDILWNSTIWESRIKFAIIDKVKQYYKTNIFSPAKLCELLDMAGGQLSYEGIDLLRSLETNGQKYVRDTMIPHPSSIKRVCLNVDRYANHIVPFKMDKMDDGSEYAEFIPKDIVLQMYKAYDLETIAQDRPICIDQSIDAAQITNRQQITVHGLKMIDVAAKDPRTKQLLYVSAENCSIQSRNNCWVTKIALCGESKAVIAQFRSVLESVKNLTINYINNFKPIRSCMDCDLSATWKLTMSGGAMRNKKFACHLCAEKDTFVGEHKAVRCKTYCEVLHKDNDKIKCRHQDIFSPTNIEDMSNQIDSLKSILGGIQHQIDSLLEKSIIDGVEDPRAPTNPFKEYQVTSIHFNIKNKSNDVKKIENYSGMINNDLDLRELDLMGSLEDRQERLRQSLISEHRFRGLQESLKHYYENDDKKLLTVMECCPCILHMENRCAIKILFMLLVEGINNAGDRNTFKELSTKISRILKFVETVETLVNTTIFGNYEQPACWRFPLDKSNNEVHSITMDNNRSRALMKNCTGLINLCVRCDNDNHARIQKFYDCISNYNKMFEMLRKKDDFTDDEILEFQKLADYFYDEWIDLQGREGITNYIHMIGSGHVADFLYEFRNLYRHSQQGWEHLNSFLKVYFFRRTMRGGGTTGGSKIKPLAKWLARRMVWMAGTTYETILDFNSNEGIVENESIDDEDIIFDNEDSLDIHDHNLDYDLRL
jgi:hypothetical protein